MVIFEKMYDGNNIVDIEDDIYEILESDEIEQDSHGLIVGNIRVTVEYFKED